ncbi:MAG: hypothetical protein JO020_29130 [Chloroflexi bacterium]|nr:hypothetical protein [Chloroflexota bacterium]MBV9898239.1 hypothetical protein [Chloroflexota bacterium]
MAELTSEQQALVETYLNYTDDELNDLIGNLSAEYGDAQSRQEYVLGIPDARERGVRIVADLRQALCERRAAMRDWAELNKERLAPLQWVRMIVDILIGHEYTHGIPPIALAMALGRLCDYSLVRLCLHLAPRM